MQAQAAVPAKNGCLLVVTSTLSLLLALLVGTLYNEYYHQYTEAEDDPVLTTTTSLMPSPPMPHEWARDTDSPLISEPPNIVLLQEPLRLFERIVGDELSQFGTLILNDIYGDKVKRIEYHDKSKYERSKEMFRQWLVGKGIKPITWNSLIEVLNKTQLKTLAEYVYNSVKKDVLNVSALPYSHSEIIMDAADTLRDQYKGEQVVEFGLLNYASDMPYLNVKVTGHRVQELLNELDSGKLHRLLITGRPGAGKTTLMKHVAKEWAEGKTLQSCQILFLIYLGSLNNKGHRSLNDLLTESHKDLRDEQHIADEIAARQGAGACFLFDAYDEYDEEDYVYELMFQNKLRSLLCILTSRPYNFKKDSGLKQVEIVGFDDKNLENYLHSHSTDGTLIESILNTWKTHPKVREMCTLPLNFVLLIAIKTNAKQPLTIQTRTQLYAAFMNTTIMHYKKPQWNTVSLRQCILNASETRLCKGFKALHQIAYKMIFQNQSTFPDNLEDNEVIKKLGFVSVIKEAATYDQVKYTFTHPTFCEFFAALHLTSLPHSKQLDYVTLYSMRYNRFGVFRFYFGLLSDLYPSNISAISTKLERYSILHTPPIPTSFSFDERLFMLVQELGLEREATSKLLESLPNLPALEIYTVPGDSGFEELCKYFPRNLQQLTLSWEVIYNLTDLSMLSDTLKKLHNLTSLTLISTTHGSISGSSLKILVKALKNLRYLNLALSADTNVESLTQLTSLHHLRLQWLGAVPQTFKDPLIKIFKNLTELRSIQVLHRCVNWSEEDKIDLIRETRHLGHLRKFTLCTS